MADLTASRNVTVIPGKSGGHTYSVPMLGVTNFGSIYRVYSGDLIITQAADAGYGKALLSGVTFASGDVFLGISKEKQLIDSDPDGKVLCTVLQEGWASFPVGALTQADVGKLVYATDAETLTLTALNNALIGVLKAVDTHAWVDIENYAGVALP